MARGHFATTGRHTNYYVDVAAQKSRLSEAKAVAEELRSYYYSDTVVDTILCLEGTEVIGTCLAEQLTKADFVNMNSHKTIYIVTPEVTSSGQLMFRDNIVPMIAGKHVLVLAVSVSSGRSTSVAVDAVQYYGGKVAGISAIFSTMEKCAGFPVHAAFNPNDLMDYVSAPAHDCPMCKAGRKLDALINSYGFSKLD